MEHNSRMLRDRGPGMKHETDGKGLEPFLKMAGKIRKQVLKEESEAGVRAAMKMFDIHESDKNLGKAIHMFLMGMEYGMANVTRNALAHFLVRNRAIATQCRHEFYGLGVEGRFLLLSREQVGLAIKRRLECGVSAHPFVHIDNANWTIAFQSNLDLPVRRSHRVHSRRSRRRPRLPRTRLGMRGIWK